MTLLEWLRVRYPGEEVWIGSELQLRHADGTVSSLWKAEQRQLVPSRIAALRGLYSEVDGADLFSSAFKIAAVAHSRWAGKVKLVPTLDELSAAAAAEGCVSPAGSTVFMFQAGIGYYAVSGSTGSVFEIDDETGNVRSYSDVFAILDEWLHAMSGTEVQEP